MEIEIAYFRPLVSRQKIRIYLQRNVDFPRRTMNVRP